MRNKDKFNVFGILDGHGLDGHFVAEFCKKLVTREIKKLVENNLHKNEIAVSSVYESV